MASGLRVAVVGCGSAGPAAALFLTRAGHDVHVFERAPALGPVGTGFLLQPTGLEVLGQLELRAPVEALGARVRGLTARTRRGRTLLDLHYECLQPGLFALGMHRASLLHVLVGALEAEGVPIHCGAEVAGWRDDPAGRWLRVDNSEQGPFDLVIVANGARSRAREWTGIPLRAKCYPWGALWTIAPDPERSFPDRLFQVVDGTHTMLGFLPTGVRADDPERAPLVSIFWSVRGDHADEVRRQGREALADRIRALVPGAAPLLSRIDHMDRWAFAEYLDVAMPRWHAPRAVVLGDAAHAMSPQLGQGVNLALWDAWVLAQCIERHAALEDALAHYTQVRRTHLAFYQRATRWLTPLFQSSIPGAAALRDVAFPLLGAIPPLERQMTRSMAGVKRGVVRSSFVLGPSDVSSSAR